jgi:hypothetical protein
MERLERERERERERGKCKAAPMQLPDLTLAIFLVSRQPDQAAE